MTPISKCNALALSAYPEAPAQLFAFAHSNNIPEMAEQAETMTLNALTLRTTISLSPILLVATHCYTEPGSMGQYALTILSVANTAVAVSALKQLYKTACYLRNALILYPRLRARVLGTS